METKKKLNKKVVTIIGIIALLLISIGAYTTIQSVNASTIQKELEAGHKFYEEQQYEEAIIAYEKVLDIDEKHVEARIGLSKSYQALTKVDKAKEVLVEGINLVPDEPKFYLHLSDIEISDSNIDKAVVTLDQGYERTKSNAISEELNVIGESIVLVADEEILQIDHDMKLELIYKSNHNNTEQNSTSVTKEKEQEDADEVSSEASQEDSENNEEVELSNASGDENNDKKEQTLNKVNEIAVDGEWSLHPGTFGEIEKATGNTNTFTAIEAGEEAIIASVGSITKRHEVSIEDQVLDEFEIKASSSKVVPDEKVELSVTGHDMDNKKMKISPTWEVADGEGTLSSHKGNKVTFASNQTGKVTIIAKYDDEKASIEIEVADEDKYVLSVGQSGQGSVSVDPSKSEYEKGSIVNAVATAATGWQFERWAGSALGNNSTTSVIMDSSKTITAIFSQIKEKIEDETVVQLTEPSEKNQNIQPTKTTNNNKKTKTVKKKAKKNKKPRNKKTFTLETTHKGEGTIKRDSNKSKYSQGERVEIKAIPSDGWLFDKWNNGGGSSATLKITMDKNNAYEATFIQAGKLKGTIKDAKSGIVKSNVNIALRHGKDNKSGSTVSTKQTNEEGNYNFSNLRPGNYTMELSIKGFTSKYVNVNIVANETTTKHESIMEKSESVTGNNYSVVLTWDERPWDLDSHLTFADAHIYYGNPSYTRDEKTLANLDVDEVNGYGPETITFEDTGESYHYYVHNYSGTPSITTSNAKVEVYRSGQLIKTYHVPTKGSGYDWSVFKIENGELKTINKITQINN